MLTVEEIPQHATARNADPVVWFYLWNGSNPGEPDSWPVYDELAARRKQMCVWRPEVSG